MSVAPASAAPAPRGRVVVAMSGGVDSSVAAALLRADGHAVIGVTLRMHDRARAATGDRGRCASHDIDDARAVADHLGIPHRVLDLEERFSRVVVDAFADAYLRGETPSPCVRCNQELKFGDLMAAAAALGAEALATGHYARRVVGAAGAELHRAADPDRDQSYFLFALSTAQLERVRFPLGGMSKAETRSLAARLGLPVAVKPASQDICFAPTGGYAAALARLRPQACEPGEIVDVEGRVLGRHRGVAHFTVGQRKGLGIAAGSPLYVIGLDAAARRVIVGPRAALARRMVMLREVNWLGAPLDGGVTEIRGEVRLRSAQAPVAATIALGGDGSARVHLDAPQYGVAPGQACVFYAGTRVLGGGWISASAA